MEGRVKFYVVQKTFLELLECIGIFSSCFVPQQLQLFRRMLQRCFAVKLQECFVDDKNSHLAFR